MVSIKQRKIASIYMAAFYLFSFIDNVIIYFIKIRHIRLCWGWEQLKIIPIIAHLVYTIRRPLLRQIHAFNV